MTPSRSQRASHAPPRLVASILALLLVVSGLVLDACGGGNSSSGVPGQQPGETMGVETPASTGTGY